MMSLYHVPKEEKIEKKSSRCLLSKSIDVRFQYLFITVCSMVS